MALTTAHGQPLTWVAMGAALAIGLWLRVPVLPVSAVGRVALHRMGGASARSRLCAS